METGHPADAAWRPSGWALWALGGALGTALATATALVVLMGLTSEPAYIAPDANTGGSVSGAVVTDPPRTEITIVATEFAFEPPEFEVEVPVRLTLRNEGLIFHNLEIEGVDGLLLEAEPGDQASATVQVSPGSYIVFCSVPGHREAGMESNLTVGADPGA